MDLPRGVTPDTGRVMPRDELKRRLLDDGHDDLSAEFVIRALRGEPQDPRDDWIAPTE